jgi:hypothetical protein
MMIYTNSQIGANTMKTSILTHGRAYQLTTAEPSDSRFKELRELLPMESCCIAGDHGVHCVAIELPCGMPLYINFQHSTYAERNKGFLHFFTFTSMQGNKTHEAKKLLELDEPKRFTLKTMTPKKLDSVITYWDKVASKARELDQAANGVVHEWREKLAAIPYEFGSYSHRSNNEKAINGCAYSPVLKFEFSVSADYPHPSQSVSYQGDNTLNAFLSISDDTSADKKWFSVDFTGGLNDTLALHVCYGTEFAVYKWAKKHEKEFGAIGFIVRALPVFPRGTNRDVHIVRLGELL